jgi:hypothetical protein
VALAERLLADVAERPSDATSASALLADIAWPERIPERSAADAVTPQSPGGIRWESVGRGVYYDRWLGRHVLRLELEEQALEQVRAFARVSHPSLAAVLSQRHDDDSVWVEALPTAWNAPLGSAHRESLQTALELLHRAGGAHGAVTLSTLASRGGVPVLRFSGRPSGSPADDLEQLARVPGLSSEAPPSKAGSR